MANLQMTLTKADFIAAIQQWVSSPTGGSASGVIHQMDATVTPIFDPVNGGLVVKLNS